MGRLRLLVPLLLPALAGAVLPVGEIRFKNAPGYTYCSLAAFGPLLPSKSKAPELLLVEPLPGAAAVDSIGGKGDGCEPIVLPPSLPAGKPFGLLLPRGRCPFEQKAAAAEAAGAALVVIYNNEEGLYYNRTAVQPKLDYECANGQAWLPTVAKPLWSPANNAPACAADSQCASGRCLVTNVTDPALGTQVCCAWDVYMTMGADPSIQPQPAIPTVFVTMRDGDLIHQTMAASSSDNQPLVVRAFMRPRPAMNWSSILIWLLGVATVTFAAWNASWAGFKRPRGPSSTGPHAQRTGRAAELMDHRDQEEEEEEEEEGPPALDLSVGHTVGFIATASCFLVLLFYVDLNKVIGALYCISAGSAVANVACRPLLRHYLLPRRLANYRLLDLPRWEVMITLLDLLSTAMGLGLGVWWLLVRDTAPYAWVLQDILGIALCVLFLTLVRFPNIKVATVLLVLAFVYDVFFVFLSPVFFHESVMIKVATGGEPKADETYCEKYPQDALCQTRQDLPMLLVLPRLGDYVGGFTMLGLGDIILPGLLVAFAARYDRATGATPLFASNKGFFRAMVLGYAVGLMMANVAVYLMQTGQPALLYLVPCTLGVFAVMAHRRGLLQEMWKGPAPLAPPPTRRNSGGGDNGAATADAAINAPAVVGSSSSAAVLASPVEGSVAVDMTTVVPTAPPALPSTVAVSGVRRGGEDAPLLDI